MGSSSESTVSSMSCSVLVMTALRSCLAMLGLVYILATSPSLLLLGPLANFILNFLPGSSSLNLIVPGLTTELVCDSLLLAGFWRSWTLLLLPWLALNIMLSLGLGVGVMTLIATSNLRTSTDQTPEQTMQNVSTFLLIIILLLLLVLSLVHLLAVIQVSQSIKEQKGRYEVTDGENIIKTNVVEDQLAGERYRVMEGAVPDSSFDSYDDVP